MDIATILVGLGVLVFLAYLFSSLFEKTNIPDVLPLFLIGLVIGPVLGWIEPEMLGDTGKLLATFTIISVLFVGGLNIDILTLVRSFPKTFALMFLNLIGTILIVTAGAYYLFGVEPLAGIIVGILLGGTSSAIVIPIAYRLKLRNETRTILSIESDLNDIFTVTLALTLVSVMRNEVHIDFVSLPIDIATVFIGSVLLGSVIALIWSRILGRARLLKNNIFTTPALLLILYGCAEFLGAVGPVVILAFGITLGNLSSIKLTPVRILSSLTAFSLTPQERTFFSSLMFLFKTFFFVYIGIVMPLNEPIYLLWGAGLMLMLYLLRWILVDWLLAKDLPHYDATIVKSMLPKGLTGGALLVLIGDQLLETLTYPVILMSIIFTAVAVVFADLLTQAPEDSRPSHARREENHIPPRLLPAPDSETDTDVKRYSLHT